MTWCGNRHSVDKYKGVRHQAQRCLLCCLLLLLLAVRVHPLRLLRTAIPDYVLRGSTAELTCEYEVGDSSLYSLRWFKDDHEFFRYVPGSNPSYQVFQKKGFMVDESVSEASRVLARGLQFEASGRYRCEVSAEGPEFTTVIGHGTMLVLDPPRSRPLLSGLQEQYRVNDTVDLTCTSAPSHPPAHLTWLVNGRQPAVDEDVVVSEPMPQPGDLLIRVARLRFTATQEHFQKGELVVKCVASLAPPGYLSPQRTGLHGGEMGDYGSVQADKKEEHSGESQQQNEGEAYRKKEDHRLKVYQEQLQRAMMHFFNTWETTVRVSAGDHPEAAFFLVLVSAAMAILVTATII